MNFIQKIIIQHNERKKIKEDTCNNYIVQINTALQEFKLLFSDNESYIDETKTTKWYNNYSDLIDNVAVKNIKKLKRTTNFKKLLKQQEVLYYNIDTIKQQIIEHNDLVTNIKIEKAYELISNIEGKKLDRQQMACIVKDNHNHLVIAGAGTGKTTTILGKIKFLLRTGKYKPEDILVLSFTKNTANEMKQRVMKETGYNIDVMTFHKLGLNIISKVNNIKPKITQLKLTKFIKEQLNSNMKSEEYLNLLSSYLLYNSVVSKSEFEFNTQKEYDDYLKFNKPTTINNEIVKSYGEMDIANFLMQNGITYIYEHPYKIDTRTIDYGQYKPDFYLPDYDIYIEYFSINKNGEVPSYFEGKNGLSATERYKSSMDWKRKVHKENNTVLIECYAYEKFDGILLEKLKEKLIDNSVELKPKNTKELWEEVSCNKQSALDGVVELFETIINLTKSRGYTINTVRHLNINNSNIKNNDIILSLVEPIFNSYCFYLKEHDEIDYNDMINMAKEYVDKNKYINPYKCVIIDEYQDISKSRFQLLDSMRKSNDYDLFCVGDDWQSIYRFSGSDIGLTLNFEHYWGPTEISKIETTYRFNQSLIEISSNFIKKNPMQIEKSVKSKMDILGFALGEIRGYTDKYAIEFMAKKLEDIPKGSSVFFIGKYHFDINLLKENNLFEYQYNNNNNSIDIKYYKRPDLKMKFLTVHKSKGLQADYVFIINNKNSIMGFPSKMQSAAIIELLLDNCEQFPYAEERRLYYVALTRAKIKVYMVTVNNQESDFVLELKKQYDNEIKQEQFVCPMCGGRLFKKRGRYGYFLGCENYKTKNCPYKRNLK